VEHGSARRARELLGVDLLEQLREGRESGRNRHARPRRLAVDIFLGAPRSRVVLLRERRTRIVSWAIRDSIPVLNLVRRPPRWPALEALRVYPEGSLGRELAAFLDRRGLPFLPHYEGHDALHLVLGYDTSLQGELELQAFMWASRSSSFAGRVLLVWGALMMPEHLGAMRRGYRRGRCSAAVDDDVLLDRLYEPLDEVVASFVVRPSGLSR
jgi:hypothetical protein